MVQMVKSLSLPAVQETQARSPGGDVLERGVAPTAVFLPGEPRGQRSMADYSTQHRSQT